MKKLPFALEDDPVTASEGARHMPGLTSTEQDPLEAAYRRPSACGPVDAGRMPTRDCGESGFDALAEKIGTGLLRAPVDSLDAACSEALSRLVEYLDIERAFIALCDRAADTPRVTHTVTAGGVPGVAARPCSSELPWFAKHFRTCHEPIVFTTESRLPSEAFGDLATVRTHGMRCFVLAPITAGGQLLGLLSFGTGGSEHCWPATFVDRVCLVARIFAGALLRRDYERRLSVSLAEIETLRARLRAENEYLRDRALVVEGFDHIVGESAALRSMLFMAEQVAPTDAAVLLQGETGTGKELVARAIHAKSQRRGGALVTVNCAALPPTLIESELFGHEKGAFTGAVARRIGRFELADRGTLFLDEVGELRPALQAKLLRVLQEGEFERLGSTVTRKVDVRVIAATNRDLSAAARAGTFRADLYYRLAVFPIRVPPLRERTEDIPLLTWHFIGQFRTVNRQEITRIPAATMERLVRYAWPGNVRELRNVLERAVILSPGSTLMLDDLTKECETPELAAAEPGSVPTLEEVDRAHILRVLEICAWRVRGRHNAADRLGLKASTLYSRMKKLGIRLHSTPDARGSAGPSREPGTGL